VAGVVLPAERRSNNTTETGVFLDSAVQGISYVSGGVSGITDANGTFTYEVGSVVRFMIGDVVIGEAPGQSVITPIDLVSGSDASHPTVINIVCFLLTLDEDGNPDNGIQISEAVRNWRKESQSTLLRPQVPLLRRQHSDPCQ